jgi:hypothetical protein
MNNNERLRSAVKSVVAPPGLETRIRSQIRQPERHPAWGRYFFPLAAALMMTVGGVVAYQLGHLRITTASQNSYIASLSTQVARVMSVGLADHVHCALFRKFPKTPPAVKEMAEKLGPEFEPLLPIVKQAVPANLEIVMAHTCGYQGRRYVHLALRGDSRLLSVVISQKREGESFTKENLLPILNESGIPMYRTGVQRFEITGFESKDHLIYVISDLAEAENLQIATKLAPAVTDLLNRAKS